MYQEHDNAKLSSDLPITPYLMWQSGDYRGYTHYNQW